MECRKFIFFLLLLIVFVLSVSGCMEQCNEAVERIISYPLDTKTLRSEIS